MLGPNLSQSHGIRALTSRHVVFGISKRPAGLPFSEAEKRVTQLVDPSDRR
jgi:hypothetical protein